MQTPMLRPVHLDDAPAICAIYNHYVQHTPVTFEEVPLTAEQMRQRIEETTASYPWLVCEEDGQLLGYCYCHQWRARTAYRFSVEATIYLQQSSAGKGRGSLLLEALLNELRSRKLHSVIAGVLLPNPPSTALLEKFGFRQVAQFKEVGFKFDRWLDVGYWQLLLYGNS